MPPVTLPPAPGIRPTPTTAPAVTPREVGSGTSAPSTPRPPPPPTTTSNAGWRNFTDGTPRPEARIHGLHTPLMNASGLVDFEWEKPGDSIPFEMTVEVRGDPNAVRAEVWSNVNHNDDPTRYEGLPMKVARVEGSRVTYRVDIPVEKLGNYRATARVSVDGGTSWQWAGQHGIGDLRFRPRSEAHDDLNMMEVNVGNVNHDPTTGKYGTFADMMESGSPQTNGKYTLEHLAAQGKNAIWLMPPFEISKWDQRHPLDDAGSPYAVKDFFSVRTELSRAAQGLTGEAARDAAMKEFKDFVAKAHSLGIKVMLDVPLNHVGHNYEFRDLFTRYDQAGREVREVRKNDFSNFKIDPEQLRVIERRLADPNLPKYMEYLAPWMYGSRTGNPAGASNANDKAPGGWFEWADTAQLNHGRMRWGYHWWDVNPDAQQKATQDWLTRILRFWAVDMDVDGFRLDHLTGLPLQMLEHGANLVQADVDKHQPGKALFLMGEDFHTSNDTRHYLDAGQAGWFHEFLRARSPADLQRIMENPWFHDLLNLDSHDEERLMAHFGDDYRAAARLAGLLQLLGGPVTEVAGDELGEKEKLLFKQYKGVHALRHQSDAQREMARTFGKLGAARKQLAALKDDNRAWLRPRDGGSDPDLVALSRVTDRGKDGAPVLVFGNMSNERTRENVFALDEETRARIDPEKSYQVRDLMGQDVPLWNPPIKGKELMERGVFARLLPYQLQVLKLEPVG
ncbi:MAG: alpha-amylase family glycosyl hydrolase [Myxococcota bacterium]